MQSIQQERDSIVLFWLVWCVDNEKQGKQVSLNQTVRVDIQRQAEHISSSTDIVITHHYIAEIKSTFDEILQNNVISLM